MGCDIHCYIEYRRKGDRWESLGGRINPGRSYRTFERLAGVRGDRALAVATPRGFPDDAAYEAESDNYLYVSERESEGCCSRANAETWVKNGISRWRDSERVFVTHPDWHSHSWLTTGEFEKAIEGAAPPRYGAVLAAMRGLESAGFEVRLVFWFDN